MNKETLRPLGKATLMYKKKKMQSCTEKVIDINIVEINELCIHYGRKFVKNGS